MVEFNKALVAKQVCCIIHWPDSLMARILRARYFKLTNVMEAKVGFHPYYIWQSIIWSRGLIAKGLLWRVGNGRQIFACKDVWIMGTAS